MEKETSVYITERYEENEMFIPCDHNVDRFILKVNSTSHLIRDTRAGLL